MNHNNPKWKIGRSGCFGCFGNFWIKSMDAFWKAFNFCWTCQVLVVSILALQLAFTLYTQPLDERTIWFTRCELWSTSLSRSPDEPFAQANGGAALKRSLKRLLKRLLKWPNFQMFLNVFKRFSGIPIHDSKWAICCPSNDEPIHLTNSKA